MRRRGASLSAPLPAYGLPERIRSDNGPPFAGSGLARLSRLNVWWMRLGIVPERIAVGHPEQNGSHEQFHRVLKAATTRPPAASGRAQQRRFDTLLCGVQPRAAARGAADQTPARCYQPSPRALPAGCRRSTIPAIGKSVASIATGVSRGATAAVSVRRLLGEDVAFEEVDDGLWTVYFASVASRASTSGIVSFTRLPRSRRGAPPAALAPRLT